VAASGAAPDLMSLRLDATHSVAFGLDGAPAVAPSVLTTTPRTQGSIQASTCG
jgi:hypothetical protein